MSKRQRHEKIIISLDKNQKEMVKKFEQRIDTIRKKFYKSLTEVQKTLIKKRRRKSKKND
ncbi:MAG: hypothetical protein HON75_02490 [Cryomorphaceae bacterium]|nr:hypothetical protein [Cryomorphaceae bacterium]